MILLMPRIAAEWGIFMNEPWIDWARELQFLAQAGLAYSKDPYDVERFQRIREIAAEMVSHQTDIPLSKVTELFCCEKGFQTPKLETRAAVFQGGKILLVQENNGLWSLPGGWVDVDQSIRDNTEKEVREEAGLAVMAERIIALQDRNRHNTPAFLNGICKVFVLCQLVGGEFQANLETVASGWFDQDSLPPLCEDKTTAEQIAMCYRAAKDECWQPEFD